MDAITMLRQDRTKVVQQAADIVAAADAEGRPLTDEDIAESTRLLEMKARLDERIKGEEDKNALRGAIDKFENEEFGGTSNPVREPAVATKARKPGDALVGTDWFKGFNLKIRSGVGIDPFTSPTVEVPYPTRMKAAGDPVLESDGTNTALFGTGGAAGALTTLLGLETPGFVQYPLTIADLITNVPITVGNSATYPVVSTRTLASGTPVTEGQNKPGTEYEFDVETKVLETLAAWVKVSTQFLEDAPGLAAYINADLPLQVRQNEEASFAADLYAAATTVVDGTGIGGIVTQGGAGFDAIQEAITRIMVSGGRANALVIHPNDWAAMLIARAVGGDEHYLGGGPFGSAGNPWGLTPVVTTAATETLALVGDFSRGVKAYRRGGMQVRSTNSDGTDFIKNLVTILAELRVVLGVTYPEFFVQAEINASS